MTCVGILCEHTNSHKTPNFTGDADQCTEFRNALVDSKFPLPPFKNNNFQGYETRGIDNQPRLKNFTLNFMLTKA